MVKVMVCPEIVPEIAMRPVPWKADMSMEPVALASVWVICHVIRPAIMPRIKPPMLPLPIAAPPDSDMEPPHIPA